MVFKIMVPRNSDIKMARELPRLSIKSWSKIKKNIYIFHRFFM